MVGSALHLGVGVLTAADSAPSKVPFYVAGGLFACWAVVLSAIGLRRADFPTSGPLARMVMGISLALMLATGAMAVVTGRTPAKEAKAAGRAPEEGAPAQTGAARTTLALSAVSSGELLFDKRTLSAKAGKVAITFTNPSDVAHNVTLEKSGRKVAASQTITKSKATVTATLTAGQYTFYCSVDSHRQGGMKGTLTVR